MQRCTYCGFGFPIGQERCPHCAKPGFYPNVSAAECPEEVTALNERHAAAWADVTCRGANVVAERFQSAVERSRAVVTRPLLEIERLASSDREIYASFYEWTNGGIRLPEDDEWVSRRRVTDEVVFPGFKEKIRFAALSLDDIGLPNYGRCCMFLKEGMIAHRSSVFEENTVSWMKKKRILVSESDKLPFGSRATWSERGKLALAKLGHDLKPDTPDTGFPQLLLRKGRSTAEDLFIEVHIWGPFTIRSVDMVYILPSESPPKAESATIATLKNHLEKWGVRVILGRS